ncbi:ABC transporter substrate-binding protein [Allosphingosinicella deserti]|nr:ABC transporter substrate-binding protein [Sphingomonas deserti]
MATVLALAGCRAEETGPVTVVGIGGAPRLLNPNADPLDAPSAFLVQSSAQGLVRFDAAGEIEPALAERWIVSNDGLRYTFRLARLNWTNGSRITAEQVAARLRAAGASPSRNPLKPLLGAIDEIEAMTDEVIEISLKSPRPNFLQLLAQPEMAVLRNGEGSGPYRIAPRPDGAMLLTLPRPEEDEEDGAPEMPRTPIILSAARAGLAVARFGEGDVDGVLGGTLGDLPVARQGGLPNNALAFDPAAGLFGFSIASNDGPLASAELRQALSMAIDRNALVAGLAIPALSPRETLLPAGVEGLAPAAPAWTALPLSERRALAVRTIAAAALPSRLRIRVALPDAPGYRLLFAYVRRDWATIGVAAERVAPNAKDADLRLIDEVAPIGLASWYLRHFECTASRICDAGADLSMSMARIALTAQARRGFLANADRILADAAPFIPLASPVRWSLVSPRLTGFRANVFARHHALDLIREQP